MPDFSGYPLAKVWGDAVRHLMENLLKILSGLNGSVSKVGCNIAAVLLAAMISIVLAQVFYRYVLNEAFGWSEEIAKVMMVWVTFLVSPWAYRYGAFVSVDMFVEPFGERFRLWLHLLIHLLVLWALYVFLLESVDFWQKGRATLAATLPIRLSWFYSIVPVAFGAMLLVAFETVLRILMTLFSSGQSYLLNEKDA